MPNQQDDQNSRGVSFSGTMPVQWEERALDGPLSRLETDEKNARLLKAMLVSQDLQYEYGDESGDRGVADLARVEAKLDLLLDMVSQLLRSEQQDAIQTTVVLWLSGASWISSDDHLPSVGERLWLALYIDSRLAQPLRLPVLVTDITSHGGTSEITVAFESLDEPVEDLMGKLIFRQHRRMIAQQKAEKRSGPD
ncbi:PilZ domain-containing protein [Sedimenticola selenatireducens]|nr:PilZ domain-containing protein [Sedimenticola selenatireducens]